MDAAAADPFYIQVAPPAQRGDRELVLAAVGGHGAALEHAYAPAASPDLPPVPPFKDTNE